MAASVEGFLEKFPEFDSRGAEQIAGVLASVELRIDPEWDGSAVREEVVYLELAETLSAGTQGRNARAERSKGGGNSKYAAKLEQLKAVHALGRRLA